MEIVLRKEKVNFFNGKENLLIFHISDLHLRYSVVKLNKIESLIVLNRPNLIIFTGDYFDIPKGAYNFRTFLFKISKINTVIFIRGNHDKMYGTKISNLLLDIPNCFSVENKLYKYKSDKGYSYNITSWGNRHYLPKNKTERNIVLIHNPEKIIENDLLDIQLILAGHLHGGQFVFFKTKDGSNFPGCILYKHCIDRKQIKHTTLIVSKGLGDTFPFRFNCPKEIVSIIIE